MRKIIALDGVWQFAPDDGEDGMGQRWYERESPFERTITVPGGWQAQGVYAHTAWYRRSFSIPSDWRGKRIRLHFGGVSYETDVWINGLHVLSHEGHMLPFEVDVSRIVWFGDENTIVVRVRQYDYANVYQTEQLGDKLVGVYGCWITWGGIFQSVTLEATTPVWIDHVFLLPDIDQEQVTARVQLANETDEIRMVRVSALVAPGEFGATAVAQVPARGVVALDMIVSLRDVTRWTPEQPHLYTAELTISEGVAGPALDSWSSRFGMRQIEVRGKQILLNHEPIFLRGWLDDAVYPEQISPTITVEQARTILNAGKEYGFNFVRHHTHVPVVAFHEAADEVGVLQLQEFASFGSIGNPRIDPTRRTRQQIFATWRGMIRRDCNHPSLIAYGVNNECWNEHEFLTWAPLYRDLYKLGKQLDPTRLIIDNSGGEANWSVASDIYDKHLYQYPTEQEMIDTTKDRAYRRYIPKREAYFNVDLSQVGKPCLVTEVGGWCTFPDFPRIHARTGGTPWWLSRDMTLNPRMGHALVNRMEAEMPADLYPVIVANSERYAGMANKIQVEHMRQTPGISGYAYCTFTDCYNWGAGILDNYLQPKSYAGMFRNLNQPSVLLWVHDRWCFRAGDTIRAQFAVSHFGRQPVVNGPLRWRLTDDDTIFAEGVIEGLAVDAFTVHDFPLVSIALPAPARAIKLTLRLELSEADQHFENDWSLWVLPAPQVDTHGQQVSFWGDDFARWQEAFPFIQRAAAVISGDVLITSSLTEVQIAWLEAGGRVLWLQNGSELSTRPYDQHPAVDYHATIVHAHPITAAFPNEGWCDLQFHHLMGSAVLDTGYFEDHMPIIEAFHVPYWTQNPRILPFRRKGFLAEAQVGRGRLLTTTFRFDRLNSGCPEVEAMAAALIVYLLAPTVEAAMHMSADDLREWAFGSVEGAIVTNFVPFLF